MTRKSILVFIAIQILIISVFLATWLTMPRSELFEQHYLNAVADSQKNLERTKGQKRIVLIGGSSLSFGVSAKELSERLKMPVVNLGFHAALGYKNAWAIYDGTLDPEKDLIVLSPEYSIMIDYKYSEQYCDLIALSQEWRKLLTKPHCFQRVVYMAALNLKKYLKNKPINMGVYNREGVNEYGDATLHYHVKADAFITSRRHTDMDPTIIKEYIRYVRQNILGSGFRVVYIPTVVPKTYCQGQEQEIVKMQQKMATALGSTPNLSVDAMCFNNRFFYDTEYHMNYGGVQRKTDLFHRQIKAAISVARH